MLALVIYIQYKSVLFYNYSYTIFYIKIVIYTPNWFGKHTTMGLV